MNLRTIGFGKKILFRKEVFQMKSFMKEFKEFISRGNVMDMAVGIIIGGAFTAIVTSLVEDVITPIIGMIGGFDFSSFVVTVNNSNIAIGNFINAVINFLLIAFVLFSIIKAMNKAAAVVKKPEEEAAPTTKICPFCKSEISIEATRCPHCTSQLEQ